MCLMTFWLLLDAEDWPFNCVLGGPPSMYRTDDGSKREQRVGGGGDLFRCQGRWSGWHWYWR